MAIKSGLNERCYVDEFLLSDNVSTWNSNATRNQYDVTTLADSAMARIGLTQHGQFNLRGFFDDAAGKSHPVFSAMPTTDRQGILALGPARGDRALAWVSKETMYALDRTSDGRLDVSAAFECNGFGIEAGHLLTADQETATTTGGLTGFDDGAGAATDFGLQAYLNVSAFTGTSCVVSLDDSDDDGAGDAYATVVGSTFTAVTAVGAQRIQTGRTENVKEWLRVNLAGTFTSITFSLVVVRNLETVNF